VIGLDLAGVRIVVVGASAGIGREVAVASAAAGAGVVAVGRRQARLDELGARQPGIAGLVADLRDPDACALVVDEAVRALGGIDAVVLALGASPLVTLAETDAGAWRDVIATNTVAPALITRAALAHLSDRGIVAFLSSESVGRPRRGLVPYSASKAALDEQIKGWRTECPEHRFIRLVVGATTGTDFARDFDGGTISAYLDDWVAGGHLAETMMQPAEVGQAIVEVLAVALAHPAIDLNDIAVVPPGPMMRLSPRP
jgi:NAD(P)-dependent dehydrogenase (short-subunit alcohol dehydrogenase family)